MPDNDRSDDIWMWAAAAVAALVVAIPTMLGFGLWWLGRRYLERRDWLITGATSAALIALAFNSAASGYFRWLGQLIPPEAALFPLPWFSLACYAVLVASVLGAMDGTRAMAKMSEKMHLSGGDSDSVLPTEAQRERVRRKVRDTDAEFFAIDAEAHTPDSHEMGNRSFTLGLDPTGTKPVRLSENEIRTHAVVLGATGSGKALAVDTPIPTPSGWTTMGDLSVGDWVFGADGKPVQVSFATDVMHDHTCFEVVFSDGSTVVADADHRWLTETRGPCGDRAVRTTAEIAESLEAGPGRSPNHSIPVAGALDYGAAERPGVDPYLLGVLLAAGRDDYAALNSTDGWLVAEVRRALPGGVSLAERDGGGCRITGEPSALARFAAQLEELGLRGAEEEERRAIPRSYLQARVEDRVALLQGLMDSRGEVDAEGVCVFATADAELAETVVELLHGLGMQTEVRDEPVVRLGGAVTMRETVIRFATASAVFRDPHRAGRIPAEVPERWGRRYIVDVRPHPSVPVRCIQVDSEEHLYLAGRSCVITHNTETLKNLAGNLGDLGWSVIVLDLKEDTAPGGLRDFISAYARSHALRYQELALSNPHNTMWFNPLLGMTLDEAINTIMSLQTFDDGYWQAVNKTMIGQVCTLFYDAHEVDPSRFPAPDMYAIGRLLREQNLPQATKEMRAIVLASKPERHPDDFSALARPSQAEQQSASGLGSRIVNMFESEAGRGVLRPGEGREVLDVCAGGFVYVGLNTLGLSELARVVSTSALLRLAAYAGARTTGAVRGELVPTAVIIDEANWIDRRQVQNLLSRARSAGIAVVLCTQGPEDWNDEHGQDWNTITQNTNVSIIMRQGNEHNAELCAELIGKKVKTSVISQIRDGEVLDSGSQSERLDYVVPTAEIRGLRVGEAILKVGVPYERVEYCAVRQRQPDDHARRTRRR